MEKKKKEQQPFTLTFKQQLKQTFTKTLQFLQILGNTPVIFGMTWSYWNWQWNMPA